MDQLDTTGVLLWVDSFATAIRDHRGDLNELDRLIGDGDFGTNVNLATSRAMAVLPEKRPAHPGEVFAAVSLSFFGAGGTCGPLFGSWFRAFAEHCVDGVTAEAFAGAVTAGLAVVQQLGGAEAGHKTMVDAIAPAERAVRAGGGSLRDVVTAAAEHAADGAEQTRQLCARRGRARYVGTNSRGIIDPGALAIALFFDAGVSALDGRAASTTARTSPLFGQLPS